MDHFIFLAANLLVLVVVLYFDRKNLKNHAWLWIVGLAAALVFENITTYLGFWFYHSEPKAGLVAMYTWLLYVPYLSFTYFIGNLFAGDKK